MAVAVIKTQQAGLGHLGKDSQAARPQVVLRGTTAEAAAQVRRGNLRPQARAVMAAAVLRQVLQVHPSRELAAAAGLGKPEERRALEALAVAVTALLLQQQLAGR